MSCCWLCEAVYGRVCGLSASRLAVGNASLFGIHMYPISKPVISAMSSTMTQRAHCDLLVLTHDASEDDRVALALEESEAKLSGIISVAADAIISVDRDQRITIFTRGAEAVFGYTREEVIGQDLGMLLPAGTRDKYRQRIAGLVADPDVTRRASDGQVTMMAVRKSGEEFSAEATISKLMVGRRTLLTVAIRDITERERIEMERMVLSEAGAVLSSSLDYRVTLRTLGDLVVRHIAQVCIINMIEADATVRLLTVAHADPTKAAVSEWLAKLSTDRKHPLTRTALETKQPQLFGAPRLGWPGRRARASAARPRAEVGARGPAAVG
jgi:PAS domain S-box-containing protein